MQHPLENVPKKVFIIMDEIEVFNRNLWFLLIVCNNVYPSLGNFCIILVRTSFKYFYHTFIFLFLSRASKDISFCNCRSYPS